MGAGRRGGRRICVDVGVFVRICLYMIQLVSQSVSQSVNSKTANAPERPLPAVDVEEEGYQDVACLCRC
jgi:hypothetical protein